MDLKNLESVELNNRIISLENQVKIEKEVNENARQDISRLRDITENA
jgi:ribosomal protein S13